MKRGSKSARLCFMINFECACPAIFQGSEGKAQVLFIPGTCANSMRGRLDGCAGPGSSILRFHRRTYQRRPRPKARARPRALPSRRAQVRFCFKNLRGFAARVILAGVGSDRGLGNYYLLIIKFYAEFYE